MALPQAIDPRTDAAGFLASPIIATPDARTQQLRDAANQTFNGAAKTALATAALPVAAAVTGTRRLVGSLANGVVPEDNVENQTLALGAEGWRDVKSGVSSAANTIGAAAASGARSLFGLDEAPPAQPAQATPVARPTSPIVAPPVASPAPVQPIQTPAEREYDLQRLQDSMAKNPAAVLPAAPNLEPASNAAYQKEMDARKAVLAAFNADRAQAAATGRPINLELAGAADSALTQLVQMSRAHQGDVNADAAYGTFKQAPILHDMDNMSREMTNAATNATTERGQTLRDLPAFNREAYLQQLEATGALDQVQSSVAARSPKSGVTPEFDPQKDIKGEFAGSFDRRTGEYTPYLDAKAKAALAERQRQTDAVLAKRVSAAGAPNPAAR